MTRLIVAGPSLSLRVRSEDAHRYGMSTDDIAAAIDTALLGRKASTVLQGDRVFDVRVRATGNSADRVEMLKQLPLRSASGVVVLLGQVVDIREEPGQLELRREDLRQDVAITGRLEGRDLGSAIDEIRRTLANQTSIPPSMVELGGLYQQQQESFRNLTFVLAAALLLVFSVLLIEFGSFREPLAIVFGAVLALFGSVVALWVTGTSLNVISFLGAIIGVGIVAKNGILMLDLVDDLLEKGHSLGDAVTRSGARRLRPVLMTSLACALGMLPLAYGIGHGADMLRPLAIAVMGALLFSVLLSLIATPTMYVLICAKSDRTRSNQRRSDASSGLRLSPRLKLSQKVPTAPSSSAADLDVSWVTAQWLPSRSRHPSAPRTRSTRGAA